MAALLACALHGAGALAATPDEFNPDNLQRVELPAGPDNQRRSMLTWDGRPWREIEISALGAAEFSDTDVCFEAKFEQFQKPNRVRIAGSTSVMTSDEPTIQATAAKLRSGDNIWVFGTLRKGAKGIEVEVAGLFKLPSDEQRYDTRIRTLSEKEDADGLFDLSLQIDKKAKTLPKLDGLQQYERLMTIKGRAVDAALQIKEKKVNKSDADEVYALAMLYRERRVSVSRMGNRYRELIRRCLEINPDHPRAVQEAVNLRLVRVGDKWMSPDEAEELRRAEAAARAKDEERRRVAEMERKRMLEEAVAHRVPTLVSLQAALRTGDLQAREGAIRSLGEKVEKGLDPGFGLEAVEILANLQDPGAVMPGLSMARKSEIPLVRQHAYEALVWRGARNRPGDKMALTVLADALRTEKDKDAFDAGIEALLAAGGLPAVTVMMAALDNPNPEFQKDLVDALRRATRLTHGSRDAWQDWWRRNRDSLPPNSFRN